MVHGLMDTIPRTKTKTLPLRKMRVYHSKYHMLPHPVIDAILNVILNFYSAEKHKKNASQILQIQPKTIRNSY